MVGMFEAFELDWLRPEVAEEHRGVLAWLSFMADAGGDHGWDLGIAQAPGRHLEMVSASNCRGAEPAQQHVDTPAVNWLGNLTTDMAGNRAGTEPSRIRTSDYSREIAVTRLR